MEATQAGVVGRTLCAGCGAVDVTLSQIDGREMRECLRCGEISYEKRTVTGPQEMIRDDIVDGVHQNGAHEIDYLILINSAFGSAAKGPSMQEIHAWAAGHRLEMREVSRGGDLYARFSLESKRRSRL